MLVLKLARQKLRTLILQALCKWCYPAFPCGQSSSRERRHLNYTHGNCAYNSEKSVPYHVKQLPLRAAGAVIASGSHHLAVFRNE